MGGAGRHWRRRVPTSEVVMRIRNRKYPKYAQGQGPASFTPLGNGILWNETIKGCKPLTVKTAGTDPDMPQERTSGSLFTHPSLPGLMLKKVGSIQELFSLGSSFALGPKSTSVTDGHIDVAIGVIAEDVLLGEVVGRSLMSNSSPFVDVTPKYNSGTASWETPFGVKRFPEMPQNLPLVSSGYWQIPKDWTSNNKASDVVVQIPDVVCRLPGDTQVSTMCSFSQYTYNLRKVMSGSNIGGFSIMAVLTDGHEGWIGSNSGVVGNGVQSGLLGWMASPVDIGGVAEIAKVQLASLLAEAPSDTRKYLLRGFDAEIQSIGDRRLHIGYGTTWYRNGSDDPTDRFYSRETGWIVPMLDVGPSITNASYGVFYGNRPIDCLPMREIVPFDPAMGEDVIAQWHCNHCWADAGRVGKDLRVRRYVAGRNPYPKSPRALKALCDSRAIAYSAAFGSSELLAAAKAAGVKDHVGTPQEVLVPTLQTDFQSAKVIYAQLGMDHLTYGFVREMREFFRRVYKRAENYARDDG